MNGRGHKWRRTAITAITAITAHKCGNPADSEPTFEQPDSETCSDLEKSTRHHSRVPGFVPNSCTRSNNSRCHTSEVLESRMQNTKDKHIPVTSPDTMQLHHSAVAAEAPLLSRVPSFVPTAASLSTAAAARLQHARVHDAKHQKRTQPSSRQAQPSLSFVPSSFSTQQCLSLNHFSHRFGILQQSISVRREEAAHAWPLVSAFDRISV